MKKILYLDTETTGLNPKHHDVVQVAGIIEINGRIREEFSIYTQPFDYNTIQKKALDVNKLTVKKLRTFDHPLVGVAKFIALVDKYIDRYEPSDKFIVIAHNAPFDYNFIREWWYKSETKIPFNSYFHRSMIDTVSIFKCLMSSNLIKIKNSKLSTIADYYGISFGKLGSHNALADTRVLFESYKSTLPLIRKAKSSNIVLPPSLYEDINV